MLFERLWTRFSDNSEFDDFCKEQGEPLLQFATFSALAEHHGSGWHTWPDEFRRADSSDVRRFAEAHANRIRFHQWLQWLLDEQLARAAKHISLMQDLPIGVDPDGADAWAWQDFFAGAAAVGAPPDEYNTQGQNWGLPPFIPWKLRRAGYEPFIQTIRGALRRAGGLRIDHVMGLFGCSGFRRVPMQAPERTCAIRPMTCWQSWLWRASEPGATSSAKTSEPSKTARASAWPNMPCCRTSSFGSNPIRRRLLPKELSRQLRPTIYPRFRTLDRLDLKAQRDLGLNPNEAGTEKMRERVRDMAGLSDGASIHDVVKQTRASCQSTIDDRNGDDRRCRRRGGTSEHARHHAR